MGDLVKNNSGELVGLLHEKGGLLTSRVSRSWNRISTLTTDLIFSENPITAMTKKP